MVLKNVIKEKIETNKQYLNSLYTKLTMVSKTAKTKTDRRVLLDLVKINEDIEFTKGYIKALEDIMKELI